MADQSQVEAALAAAISGFLYPNGTTAGSALGTTCRVFRGWPSASALSADLAAGGVTVTVFPEPNSTTNTTRWSDEAWTTIPAPTLLASVTGTTATFTGTADASQVAGLLIGSPSTPLARAYAYRAQAGDTPALVAAALAAAVADDPSPPGGIPFIINIADASVSVLNTTGVIARTVADASAVLTVRQQQQLFRLSIWCPDPATRDTAASLIDRSLAPARFLALADGSSGRLRYVRTATYDQSQNAKLYRRDLIYAVDYPTTLISAEPLMLFADLGFAGETLIA